MGRKYLIFTIALLAISNLFFIGGVKASSDDNVWGWAWSDNIGWVSFNCTSEETCGSIDYGVHINEDGTFIGKAWSDNIGWIDFAPASGYPEDPQYSAKVDSETGEVSGWARALNYGDDWDGWLSMIGTDPDYGVSIDFTTGEFSGYAWKEEVIGWLNFKEGDYGVMTSFSFAPSITNLTNEFPAPCSQSRIPTFSWETDAELPYDYQIKLCSNSDCTGPGDPLASYEALNTSSTSWAPACTYCCNIAPYDNIDFGGGTYYGQVRARDTGGEWSGWVSSSFTTYNYCYPYADFLCDGASCVGMEIDEEVVITLTNNSTTYDGLVSCSWVLPDIAELLEGYTTSDCEIKVGFSAPPPGQRQQDITLVIADTSNYECSTTDTIEIRFPLPEYREVPPISWLNNLFANLFTKVASVFASF
ncbi:MAG: hypothetical protein PHY18_06115 [Dehalococcoidales bacterium]|nr:hypothetical protein [Dehalococcoidales bacterium]